VDHPITVVVDLIAADLRDQARHPRIVVVAVPSPFTVPNRIAVAVRVARRVLTALALFDASVERAGVVVRASARLAFGTAGRELAHLHIVAVVVFCSTT